MACTKAVQGQGRDATPYVHYLMRLRIVCPIFDATPYILFLDYSKDGKWHVPKQYKARVIDFVCPII